MTIDAPTNGSKQAEGLQPEWILAPADPTAVAVTFVGDRGSVGSPGDARAADDQVSLSWREVELRGRRVARALDGAGVTVGNVWGVLAHNRAEWVELTLGNVRAGSRIVPLNWHLTATELAALLTDSGSELLVVEPGLRDLAAAAAEIAGVERIIELGADYEAWLDAAGDEVLSDRPAGSPMMFTGGTTGRSKGVTRSEMVGDIASWPELWSRWGSFVRMPDHGTSLVTTPLYHALGTAVIAASLAKGVPVVITGRFDPERTLALIEQYRVTSGPMVPTQFIRMLKLDNVARSRRDLSSLEWILHTAAPCPAWAKVAMIEWFGPVIYEMYGSSEGTGPAICDSHEWLAHPGTVGKASPRIEYSIVDEDGNDLPAGEVGAIYCRRADGAPEYHGDPAKTAAMQLPDGRFTVGDLGWLDADGFLYLADRRVDLILVAGSNVYPAEIEAVLVEHPMVGDAAAFGIPDADMGEQVKAVLEPVEGVVIDIDAVASFAAERLARYKLPTSYDVVAALPREAHGKLKKRLLRDPYWA